MGGEAWDVLPGNVSTALTGIAYNYGSVPQRLVAAIKSGDVESIAVAVEGLADDNDGVNRSRRMEEAAMIRGKATPPRGLGPAFAGRPQVRPADLESTSAPDVSLASVATGGGTTRPESLTGELQRAAADEGTRASPKRTPEASRAILSVLSKEAKERLVRLFGNEEGILEAIVNGEVALEDVLNV